MGKRQLVIRRYARGYFMRGSCGKCDAKFEVRSPEDYESCRAPDENGFEKQQRQGKDF